MSFKAPNENTEERTSKISSLALTFDNSSQTSGSSASPLENDEDTSLDFDDGDDLDGLRGIKIGDFCEIDVELESESDSDDEESDNDNEEEEEEENEEEEGEEEITNFQENLDLVNPFGNLEIPGFPLPSDQKKPIDDDGFERVIYLSDIIDPREHFCLDEAIGPSVASQLIKSTHPLRTLKEIANDKFATHSDNARKELGGKAHLHVLAHLLMLRFIQAHGEGLDERDYLDRATPRERLTADYCGSIQKKRKNEQLMLH